MDELVGNIRAAILDLIPKVRGNREELAARLARRELRAVSKPPRAWCLAVRASDTRMTPSVALIEPPYAVEACYRRVLLKTKLGETRPVPVSEEIRPHAVTLTS